MDVPEHVIETPVSQGRLKAFVDSGGPKKLAELIKQAKRIAMGHAPFAEKADAFVSVAERISETIVPFTPCTNGCSHCCYMATAVSQYEADMIGRYIGRTPMPVGVDLVTYSAVNEMRGRQMAKYTGERCSLLTSEGKCSVYPVRPIACRTHHNMAEDESNCRVQGVEGGQVATTPAINVEAFLVTHAVVFFEAGQRFADIRDWFPSKG